MEAPGSCLSSRTWSSLSLVVPLLLAVAFYALPVDFRDVCTTLADRIPVFREAMRSDTPPTLDFGFGTTESGVCYGWAYGRLVLIVRCTHGRCTYEIRP